MDEYYLIVSTTYLSTKKFVKVRKFIFNVSKILVIN